MLTIKNETKTSADLYIYGTIIDDDEANWIKFWNDDTEGYQFPADLKRQLDSLKGKDLNIYINSDGGLIPAGLAMAHMIERHDGKTTAIVDGYCCSIATQIFFAADRCQMYKNSYLMIHKPWSMAMGDANKMRKVAEILDTLQKGNESTYLNKIKPEAFLNAENEIHNMVEAETWFTGTEAAEKFQIELLEAKPLMNCCGSVDRLKAMGAKKIPSSLNFLPENKTPPKEDWNKIKITLARAKGAM